MRVLKRTLLLLCLGSFTSNGNLLHSSNNHAFQSLTIQNNVPIGSSIVRQSNESHAGTSSTGSSNSSNTDINSERNIHGNASTFDIQELLKNLSLFGETKNTSSRGNVNSETLLNPSVGVSSMRSQTQNSSIFAGNLAKMIQDIYDKIATYMTTFQGNSQPVANSVGYIHSVGHAINLDKVTIEDTTNGNNGNVNALYQKLINLCQQQCRSGPCPSSCPQAYLGAWSRMLRSVRATKEAWSRIRSNIP
ncbi:hypothetical protein CHS0354_010581 [Potamilus streckersoni]|uniref:Uncharacterized protein n=1 Tax=Potamilus streckersoni TaxID=2493646 RepID=A0AAE0S5S8_9BIVA|nr:hypothetical protein CHS0354_010581 [Potamilus streckersoni]